MNERLKETFQGGSPDTWENGKMAYMRYSSANIWYQTAGLHYEGTRLYRDHDDINGLDEVNFPIIAQGIIAYILVRLGKVSDDKICSDYYQTCLSKYKDVEKNKRGAYRRDLDSEFYPIHLREENEKINKSELLFSYLNKDESDVIREFVNYYFDFIEANYYTELPKITEAPQANTISVPLWALYYHYLQEAKRIPYFGGQEISKNDDIKNMISENGHTFSPKSFRNIFYAIGTTSPIDPLKESYLKKVIELLEAFPLAKQLAQNDLYSLEKGVKKDKYK